MTLAPNTIALVLLLAASASAELRRALHDTPTRRFDVEHRDVRVRFDFARKAIEGSVTLSGEALDSLTALVLDAREIEVSAASDSARGPLAFESDGARLTLRFPRALRRGERAAVTVRYAATPRAGLYWMVADAEHPRRRAEVWSQNEGETGRFWIPDFDQPVERASSDLYYTVPASMFALGNGRLIEATSGPRAGERTYHWRMEFPHPSYLVMVAAGTFARVDTTWRGVPVEYVVPPDQAENARRSLGRTPEMMEFFSSRFGLPYPYSKYAQVVVQDFTYGGMENITSTTLTERALLDRSAWLDQPLGAESLVAHELAHQWFGDYVTCREWAHAWLNEGFATYCSSLWFEHAWGRDEMDRSLIEGRDTYFREDATKRRPIVDPNYRLADDLFDRHSYNKGAWVLHMLRRKLGDEGFDRAVHHHLVRNGGRSVDTEALREALEEATGVGLDGFFEQWLHRAGHPDLKLSWEWLDERRLARVVVEQTQPSDSLTPVFRFDLPIRFALEKGEARTVIKVDGRRHETYESLPARPRYVEANDDLSVLCRISFDRPVGELAAQLVDAPLAASRTEAARALGEKAGVPAALEALAKALRSDRFYGVRMAAAEAMGRAPTPAGLAALGPGLADPDARVRRAATATLGGFGGGSAAAAASAARRALQDPAFGVVNQGLMALARLAAPEAYGELTRALLRPAWQDSIACAALAGLAELGDPRAFALVVEATSARRSVNVRAAATAALGKLGARLPAEPQAGKTTRRDARRALEPLLWDEKVQVRRAAAEALGTLGDRDAREPLARLIEREVEGRVIMNAIEAQEKLRAAGDQGLGDLRQKLERLTDQNRALEARLKALEEGLKKK